MDAEKITSKYYSKIIKLPNSNILISLLIFQTAISSLSKFLYNFLVPIEVSLISFSCLIVVTRKYRASLFTSNIIVLPFNISWALLGVKQSLFAIPISSPFVFFLMVSTTTPFLSFILTYFTELFISIPIILLLPKVFLKYSFYLLIIVIVLLAYMFYIDRKGHVMTGIPSSKVLKSFLRSLESKETHLVEEIFQKFSNNKNVYVQLVKLEGKRGTAALVIPQIHYGVYGQIGSASFIYHLEEKVKEKVFPLIFHGPGSHEMDLASSFESRELANKIAEIMNEGWSKSEIVDIKRERNGRIESLSLCFKDFKMLFLSRPGLGIDDLPSSLWNAFPNKIMIVDSHNETLKTEIEDVDVKSIKKLFYGCEGKEQELYAGWSELRLSGECNSLCNKSVKALVLRVGERDYGIIYLYGNNMLNGVRDLIRSEGTKMGFEDIEVVTPDDHSCTGLYHKLLYKPVELCDGLKEVILNALKEAKQNLTKVEVYYKTSEVSNVRVLGKFIWELLSALNVIGSFVTKTIWLPFALPLITFMAFIIFNFYI